MKPPRWVSSIVRASTLVYGLPLVAFFAVIWVCYQFQLPPNAVDLFSFFEKNLRGSLFAGFLTLGSFLLSLKTGIVIKIKEGVYDKPEYQLRVQQRPSTSGPFTIYGPLKRMSRALAWSVGLSIVTATLQLTVGLYPSWWSAAVCLGSAASAIAFLLCSFVLIQIALSDWFTSLEGDAGEK